VDGKQPNRVRPQPPLPPNDWALPPYPGATYIDVEPLPGRVLVFEQEGIPHSGEEVTKGVKYSVRTDFMYDVVPSE